MSIQTIKDNSQGMIAKIIVGLIVLTFALFGVDAIIGNNNSAEKAATVNGEDISERMLLRTTDFVKRQMLAEMGQRADLNLIDEQQARSRALNDLIERELILQVAEAEGIQVSDERINQRILSTKAFQTNGVFDRSAYEFSLRNLQMTPVEYMTEVKRDALLEQPQSGVSLSAFITQPEIDLLTRVDRQLRDFSFLFIDAENLLADVDVSDIEAQRYYQENQSDYMTEEQLNIKYLELKQSDFITDIDVDEADIKQLFEQEVAALADEEERRAAHILIDTESRDSDEAEAVMLEIQEKLAAGEDFAALAKAYSDDSGSAENGGDLGFFGKGDFVAAFEKVLFSLDVGQVSEIVDTEFGLHLIRLEEINSPQLPIFADERERLIASLRLQQAEEAFVAAAQMLQNDSFSAGDLNEPAENQNLAVVTSTFFTRDKGEGIAANEKVRRVAFSDELLIQGDNSDLIELAKDHAVVVRVNEHNPASPLPYEEVAESINDELSLSAAQQKAKQLGEKILAEVKAGKTLGQTGSDYGYSVRKLQQASRIEAGVSAEIIGKAFMMAKPASGEVSSDSLITELGDFVVMVVSGVSDGDMSIVSAQERAMVSRYLTEQVGYDDFEGFRDEARESATIEKF